jgi:hypothetical protein
MVEIFSDVSPFFNYIKFFDSCRAYFYRESPANALLLVSWYPLLWPQGISGFEGLSGDCEHPSGRDEFFRGSVLALNGHIFFDTGCGSSAARSKSRRME